MVPTTTLNHNVNAVGVDTHRDEHSMCVLDPVGRVLLERSYPTTPEGYEALRADAETFGPCRYAVECTSTYGHGLVVHLLEHGADVHQAVRPNRKMRKGGKTDAVDARAAATALLSGTVLPRPRSVDEGMGNLRFRMAARRSAVKSAAEALTQIRSLLIAADPELREQLRGLSEGKLLSTCTKWRPREGDHQRHALRDLALRVRALRGEARDHEEALHGLVSAMAPLLLVQMGVGVISAAQLLLTAGDHPERLKSADSFAALCGTTPIEASSGRTQRHRLNRGGDRQANAALHRIVIVRLKHDQRTKDYRDKSLGRGKTKREATRLLKRYVARDLYKVIREAIFT